MRILFLVVLGALIVSCTSMRDKKAAETDHAITEANKITGQGKPDTTAVKNAVASIRDFVSHYPQDSLAPKYLFELGVIYQKEQKFDSTLKVLHRVYSDYPDSKQASQALFLTGFIYANVLNDQDKAKTAYQMYLNKYSEVDSKMTNDVQIELQNLGKSPEQLLKEIEEKAKADSLKQGS